MSFDGIKRAALERTTAGNPGASKLGMEGYSGIAAGWLSAWLKSLVDRVDGKAAKGAPTPGTYTLSTITVNSDGAITSAASGSAGAVPDASTTVKGATMLSAAPAVAASPIAVGDNDGRVPTTGENDALQGTSGTPSTTNRYVTNQDARLTKYAPLTMWYAGDVATKTGVGHDIVIAAGTVDSVYVSADSAPTGGSITVTFVKEAGGAGGTTSTIGTVTLAAGSKNGSTTGLSVSVAVGDTVRMDVTTNAGYTAASAKNLTGKARESY